MSNKPIPRSPSAAEKMELAQLVARQKFNSPTTEDVNDELNYLEDTCIAVFNDYITDCPGYSGKVMLVVWGGGPEFYEAYIWRSDSENKNKKLVRIVDEFRA